ncbi:ankyrin repeat and SAM domain-containing protein 6-like [Penaeus monodon]|nr:ankyrin repeat and SAM domain-containing protein 6-like [Penaeus monodon]
MLKVRGYQGRKQDGGQQKRLSGSGGEGDLLVSSMESGGSGGSSLKTVTSSKSSKSSRSTATLVTRNDSGSTTDASSTTTTTTTPSAAAQHLTLSLGSGQLSEVLQKLALNQYLEVFLEQEVDLDAFLELSDADLQDLGITTAAARSKILRAIASLKAKV